MKVDGHDSVDHNPGLVRVRDFLWAHTMLDQVWNSWSVGLETRTKISDSLPIYRVRKKMSNSYVEEGEKSSSHGSLSPTLKTRKKKYWARCQLLRTCVLRARDKCRPCYQVRADVEED